MSFAFQKHRNVPTAESSTAFSHTRLVDTRTSTAYQPTIGTDPYGLQKNIEETRELIGNELDGCWTLEAAMNPKERALLRTFFPNISDSQPIFDTLKTNGKYGEVTWPSEKGKRTFVTHGWKDWPVPPKASEPKLKESAITKAFRPLLNNIIESAGSSHTRIALDRQSVPIATRHGMNVKPDVLVWGKGSSAFPPVTGTGMPPSVPIRKKDRECTNRGRGIEEQSPIVDWPWCVIPIEIKTQESRGATKNKKHFYQLGTYTREVFAAQPNRRFVPSLLITECTVEFVFWDRAGVVVSERIDYHANPLLFCHMLATIVTWDDEKLGFDTTAFYSRNTLFLHIRTKEAGNNEAAETVEYVVEETLVRSYTLRGRGSTCWRARKSGDNNACYIIQDAWVEGGMSTQQAILTKIEALRIEVGITGVAPFVHIEDIGLPNPDTTNHNRRDDRYAGKVDLVHTRTIWRLETPDCTLLENFTTPEELMYVLRDVTKALGQLYSKAKITHRDIVPWNILIQRGASEGSQGVLIDFSCAATLADSSTVTPRAEATPGSHVYRSCKSLDGTTTSSHSEDLESLYWVLCFMITGHNGPALATSRLVPTPRDLTLWLTSNEAAAASAKEGHLTRNFNLQVQSWFSPIEPLAANLHRFFQRRLQAQQMAARLGNIPPSVDLQADFQEFLNYFSEAIKAFGPHTTVADESEEAPKNLCATHKRDSDIANMSKSTRKHKKIRLSMNITVEGDDGEFDLKLDDIEF